VTSVRDRWDPSLENFQKRFNSAMSAIFGSGTPGYKKYALGSITAKLDSTFDSRYTTDEMHQAVKESLENAVATLRSVKQQVNERIEQGAQEQTPAPAPAPTPVLPPPPPPPPPPAPPAPPAPAPPPTPAPPRAAASRPLAKPETPVVSGNPVATPSTSGDHVLVVCHHDAQARKASLDFVTQLGLQATTLADPPDTTGRTFFDRLERLSDVKFAVVHLPAGTPGTPGSAPHSLSPALLLELGFLIRALGRNRIGFLVTGNGSKAPAWEGVAHIPMDEAGTWRLLLARAVKQAGLNVDMNRAL
jgi:predicted nucleotide-binding protein